LYLADQLVNIEIETKIKVESLDEIAVRLDALGAKSLYELSQADTYFDNEAGTLFASDCGLRLRKQVDGENQKIILTYKGPKQKSHFKSRTEIEIEVNDFEVAAELLNALDFKKSLVFEKRRQVWQLSDSAVCLDELPLLGSFIEIEASSEQAVADTLRKLQLADLPHINESYAHLMQSRLNELSPGQMEAFFD
jgi:adenylate cyclase class 2